MRLHTPLLIIIVTILSSMVLTAQHRSHSSQSLYEELQQLQQKRLPTQTLDCAKRLTIQAIREGNLPYTIEALEAHKEALIHLDYDRLPEQFSLLHTAWQRRSKLQGRDQRFLALYIAQQYISHANNFYWRSMGLSPAAGERDSVTPRHWSNTNYLNAIAPLLEVAFTPSEELYQNIPNQETNHIPRTLYLDEIPEEGCYTLLSHLLHMLSIRDLYQLELRGCNRDSWYDKTRSLLEDDQIQQTDEGAKLYALYQAVILDEEIRGISTQTVAKRLEELLGLSKGMHLEAMKIYKRLFDYYYEMPCNDPLRAYYFIIPYLEWLDKQGKYSKLTESILREIFTPQVDVSVPNFILADHNGSIELQIANVQSLSLHLYAISPQDAVNMELPITPKQYQRVWEQEYEGKSDIESIVTLTDSLQLPLLPIGHYRLQVVSHHTDEAQQLPGIGDSDTTSYDFMVSDQILLDLEDGHVQLLNALTGRASTDPVHLWSYRYNRTSWHPDYEATLEVLGELKPNNLGILTMPSPARRDYYATFFIESADHRLLLPSCSFGYNELRELSLSRIPTPIQTSILQTDRSIYQLGDEIRLYAVAYRNTYDPKQASPLPQLELTISLTTPQGDRVDSVYVVTNEWGRVEASMHIPKEAMTGTYMIEVSSTKSLNDFEVFVSKIEVSEYKQPSYEATLTLPQIKMQLGDSITVSGTVRTYSGYPLAGASVQYIFTGSYSNWWYGEEVTTRRLASGTISVNELTGTFEIPITLTDLRTDAFRQRASSWGGHSYQLEITITSPSGETQRIERSFWVGNRPVLIDYEGDLTFLKSNATAAQQFTIHVTNESGIPIATTLQLHLTSLSDTTHTWTTEVIANEKQSLPIKWLSLPSGEYRLTFIYQSDNGELLERQYEITLFSERDKSLSTRQVLWCASPSDQYSKGESPTIYYASREAGQAIYFIITTVDKPAIYGQLPALPAYHVGHWCPELPENIDPKGQIQVQLYTVHNGEYKHYSRSFKYLHTPDEPTLQISWIEKPDKLLAGESHTWQARLCYSDGTPARCIPVMAWMYDAALESLKPLDFYRLSQYSSLCLQTFVPNPCFNFNMGRSYPNGDNQGYPLYMMSSAKASPLREGGIKDQLRGVNASDKLPEGNYELSDDAVTTAAPVLRSKFSPTAFFLPYLCTDDEGVVTFSGTMPETLSCFRLCLFGYDSQLVDCSSTTDIKSYRNLMVETLKPRFLMQGDKAYLTGSVRNLTGSPLMGNLQVVLSNTAKSDSIAIPITGGSLQSSLSVPAKGVTPYAIALPPLPTTDALRVQIYFTSEGYSDGEEYFIPIEPATVRTVESVPFSWGNKMTYEYSLNDLLGTNKDKHSTLHLQLWSNPCHFAIQQLPIIFDNREQDAVSTLLRIYTLTRTRQLLRQPAIADWIKERQRTTDNTNKLHNNQYTLLTPLEQTPWHATELWVDGAQGQLWEILNSPQDRTVLKDVALLSSLQSTSGHWSWYPDMPASPLLTPLILDYLSAVYELEPLEQLQSMLSQGWDAYDRIATEWMKGLKKKPVQGKRIEALPSWGTEWLYLSYRWRGADAIQKSHTARVLASVLSPLLIKDVQKLPLDWLPQAAYTLDKLGKRELALQLAATLRDHLSHDPAQGSFFANTVVGGYFWRDRSMSLQQKTIELFEELGIYHEEVQQMRRWSMEYLRTNLRASTLTQVELLLSLLSDHSTQGPSDNVTITVPLSDGTSECFKTDSYCVLQYRSDVLNHKGRIVISHTNPSSLLWGGILNIGSKPLDDVHKRYGDLEIETKTYIREEINGQIQMRPIQPNEELSVGSILITKLRITTHRDLDFVTVRDMRPACCEPLEQISHYEWQGGLGYYVEARSNAQIYHINNLLRGSYEISYTQSVVRPGSYQRGIAQAQCAYASEYSTQTAAQPTYNVIPK